MAKQGLYANINKRKKAGTSRPKSKSTVTPKAYANMKAGFPKKKGKQQGYKHTQTKLQAPYRRFWRGIFYEK